MADPGENVKSIAHIANMGFKTVPPGTVVRFELIPDANGNFRADPDEKPVIAKDYVIGKSLKPKDEEKVTFDWKWTNDPMVVRVSVDPKNKVAELCEANNERCELNFARALRWGYNEKALDDCYDNKKINMVGIFQLLRLVQCQLVSSDAHASGCGISDD